MKQEQLGLIHKESESMTDNSVRIMVFTVNCYMCRHRLLSMYVKNVVCTCLFLYVCAHKLCVFVPVCVCVCVCVCVFLTVCILTLSLSLSGPVCVSQQGWYGFGSTRLFRSSFERWGWASQRKADGAATKWTRITTEPKEFSLITSTPHPVQHPVQGQHMLIQLP